MNKQIKISQGTHPQSGKIVSTITILNKPFVMADKRGYTMYTTISSDFAKQIIAEIPAKTLNTDRLFYLDKQTNITLSWDILSGKPQKYSLKIHTHNKGTHIWTSQDIEP